MTKKIITISTLLISILIISIYIIGKTYSLIINIINNGDSSIITNNIDIIDLVTDENGKYNNYYYDALREININDEEASILINSTSLNELLDRIITNVVDYRIHNKNRLSDREIYNLIIESLNNDSNINSSLRNKVITTTDKYINDITDYIYDFDIVENK